jgi:hypothetical protein
MKERMDGPIGGPRRDPEPTFGAAFGAAGAVAGRVVFVNTLWYCWVLLGTAGYC